LRWDFYLMLPANQKINKSRKLKILFTGGGSGGHIYPIVAIIREIKRISPNKFEFYFIGPGNRFAKLIFKKEGVKMYSTLGGKIRRYFSLKNFVDILIKFPISCLQSFFYVFLISPDLTFSKGGYGAFPASLWTWFFQIPLLTHESDVEMGRTNRMMARPAEEIFVSFSGTALKYKNKRIVVGNPIRKQLLVPIDPWQAKDDLGLTRNKPVLLILGGSQGSKFMNNVLLESLSLFLNDFNVIHQCGKKDFKTVKTISNVMANDQQLKSYHPYPFLNEWTLRRAYFAADLIISRAGAGAIFQIAALGKPSILVPVASSVAGDHQIINANVFSNHGKRAVVIEEKNFTPHFFSEIVHQLFRQPHTLKAMRTKALSFAKPEATETIARYIIQYLKEA